MKLQKKILFATYTNYTWKTECLCWKPWTPFDSKLPGLRGEITCSLVDILLRYLSQACTLCNYSRLFTVYRNISQFGNEALVARSGYANAVRTGRVLILLGATKRLSSGWTDDSRNWRDASRKNEGSSNVDIITSRTIFVQRLPGHELVFPWILMFSVYWAGLLKVNEQLTNKWTLVCKYRTSHDGLCELISSRIQMLHWSSGQVSWNGTSKRRSVDSSLRTGLSHYSLTPWT